MAREADFYGVSCAVLAIAPGATNALLISGIPGQAGWALKYFSGGSLEVIGAPPLPQFDTGLGATVWAGPSLVPLLGTGFLMGSEILSGDGPTRFYLMATGATAVAYLFRGLTSAY